MIVEVIYGFLLADFITGVIHWWEDAYGNPDWKFLGLGKFVVEPNIEHHYKPRGFLEYGYWWRNCTVIVPVAVIAILFVIFGWFDLMTGTALLLLSQSNEIHASAHRMRSEKWIITNILQDIGVLQSVRNHNIHHKSPYDQSFCIVTNVLNPLLNTMRFWQSLEWIIGLSGIRPLRSSASRNGY